MKINILIPTYNREKELYRCLESLLKCKNYFIEESINHEIFIFDNSSEKYDIRKLIQDFENKLSINLTVRDKNVGAIKNFWLALESQLDKNYDYLLFLSDDDIILNNFPSLIKKKLNFDYDLVINSTIQSNNKFTYKRKICTKYKIKDNKLNIIDNARLLTGFMISKKFSNKIYKIINNEYIPNLYDYWYQMEFMSLFHQNGLIIDTPTFIHTIDNQTFWGNYDHFKIMYYSRLESKKIAFELGYLTFYEFKKLSLDLVARGKFNYLLKGINFIRSFLTLKDFTILFLKFIRYRMTSIINLIVHRLNLINPFSMSR